MAAGFIISGSLEKQERESVEAFNASLQRLSNERVTEIVVEGPLRKSKVAWKIANYRQAILYRMVMLGDGISSNWNRGNALCSFLAGRASVETVAIFMNFQWELESLLSREDIGGMDKLEMSLHFSSRDEKMIEHFPDGKATSILTYIDKLDKKFLAGVRRHYDSLSERCHPNSFGHTAFFGNINHENGTVTYSDQQSRNLNFTHIIAAASSLPIYEYSYKKVGALILEISELHHRLHPVARD